MPARDARGISLRKAVKAAKTCSGAPGSTVADTHGETAVDPESDRWFEASRRAAPVVGTRYGCAPPVTATAPGSHQATSGEAGEGLSGDGDDHDDRVTGERGSASHVWP